MSCIRYSGLDSAPLILDVPPAVLVLGDEDSTERGFRTFDVARAALIRYEPRRVPSDRLDGGDGITGCVAVGQFLDVTVFDGRLRAGLIAGRRCRRVYPRRRRRSRRSGRRGACCGWS